MSCVLALFAVLVSAVPVAVAAEPVVSADELRGRQLQNDQGFVLIDVRPAGFYADGHIPGAENVPLSMLGSWQAPKDKEVILYCPSTACPAADAAKNVLENRGYANSSVLEGGMAQWQRKGFPVGKEKKKRPARKPRAPRMRAKEAKAGISAGELFVLDVRPAKEFAAGHLPGAVNEPLEELRYAFARIPADRKVLVYDRLPKRSREAGEKLLEAGYTAFELRGGLAGWARKKYPLEVK